MKKVFLTIGIIILSYFVYSQASQQVDTIYLKLDDARSSIKDITGWQNKGNGTWLKAKNKIPFIMTQDNAEQASKGVFSKKEAKKIEKKLKASREDKKLGKDNLQEMSISDMIINNQPYQVLMLKRIVGKYEFPLIKESFSSYESLDYYVFKSEKIEQIFPNQLVFNKPYVVDLETFISGTISYYKSKDVKGIITRQIQMGLYKHSLRSYSTNNLLFALYPIMKDGVKYMRFNLIESYNKYYVTRGYHEESNLIKIFNNQYTYEGYYRLGMRQYQYGDYYSAVASFDKALRLNPNTNDFMIYSQRGNAKHQLGDYFGAIEDFNHAIDIQPSSDTYELWLRNYYNRGISKFALGDTRDACVDWKKAFDYNVKGSEKLINKYCQ